MNLAANLFDGYYCNAAENALKLSLNLTTLLDCLQLFGSSSENTSATITYSEESAVFKLSLEESGVLTTCEISTLLLDEVDGDDQNFDLLTAFMSSNDETKLLLKSEILREAVQEISDIHGAVSVTFSVQQDAGFGKLTLSARGTLGICEIDLPRESDAFVSFQANPRPEGTSWSYPLTSLQLGMKALGLASETFIRINENGIACIQHQIETSRGQEIFIDFYMLADQSADEGDDNAEDRDATAND